MFQKRQFGINISNDPVKKDSKYIATEFSSLQTGLTCLHVNVPGPLMHGFFVLATESHSDKGLPHTLEHLVFMGSKDYPYKGVLDLLANRSIAQGTNAWTDVDHTCYTLTTAGYEGFLQMLPVYVDHILFPLNTNESFTTEVMHIDGNGKTAGVVVCEMQGRQNSPHDLLYLNLQRILYKGSGYQSETGGLVECLRDLTAEEVREYHRQYYRPNNLCLMMFGQVPTGKLEQSLNDLDQSLASKVKEVSFPRPWVDSKPPEPFRESVVRDIKFPDEMESQEDEVGMVLIGWRDQLYDDAKKRQESLVAMDCISDYLTDSPVSLLQKHFVELVDEDPYASSIDASFLHYTEVGYFYLFEGVNIDKIDKVYPLFENVIRDHLEEGLDMLRLKTIISRKKQQCVYSLETEAESYLIHPLISHFIYGSRREKEGVVPEDLKEPEYLDLVMGYGEEKWKSIIREFLLERPSVCVKAKPSSEYAAQLEKEEEEIVKKTCAKLGEDGLKKCEEVLEHSKKLNETPMPKSILKDFPVPPVDNIPDLPLDIAMFDPKARTVETKHEALKNKLEQEIKTLNILPSFPMQLSHVDSEFVSIDFIIDTQFLKSELRNYLELYMDLMFCIPVEKDGQVIDYESVVTSLNQDTISYGNGIGIGSRGNFTIGYFGQSCVIHMIMEKSKYETGIKWISDLLVYGKFTEDRVKVSINKLVNDLPNHKREGMVMCRDTLNSKIYDPKRSNHYATSITNQHEFLRKLHRGNVSKTANHLNLLREALVHSTNYRVHVVGDILSLINVFQPWNIKLDCENSGDIKREIAPISFSKEVRNPFSVLANKLYVVKMPSIESSFALFAVEGPDCFDHPDLASLMVLDEYLTAMEGIFWKEVRGTGLAYGVGLNINIDNGLIYFQIYRSQNGFKAFEAVHRILRNLCDEKIKFEDVYLDAAKSSVIYGLVSREDTKFSAASQAFINIFLKKIGSDGKQKLMNQVQKVSLEDLKSSLSKYMSGLLDPERSMGVVTCAPSLAEELVRSWKDMNYKVIEEHLK